MAQDQGDGGIAARCGLAAVPLARRKAEWAALAARHLLARRRDGDTVRLAFRRAPATEAELRRLVELERRCCPSFAFRLTAEADRLVLAASGLGAAAAEVEALFAGATEQAETAP